MVAAVTLPTLLYVVWCSAVVVVLVMCNKCSVGAVAMVVVAWYN